MKDYRLGVISDTHFPEYSGLPWDLIESHFNGIDTILHAGDITSREVVDRLRLIAPVEAVCGNMDPPDLRLELPEKIILNVNEVKIGLVHGAGLKIALKDKYHYFFDGSKIDAMVFGHTHLPFNRLIDNILFFNPGSPAKPCFPNKPTIGILTVSQSNQISGEIISL